MNISAKTLDIFKNFSLINTGIVLTPGNTIQTRTTAVLAQAVVPEEFPATAPIYDLNNFLAVVNLFNNPEFEFNEEYIGISDGKSTSKYTYPGHGVMATPAKMKPLEIPAQNINFILKEDELGTIQKAAGALNKPEIVIISDGTEVRICTEDHNKPGGNTYSLVVDAEPHGFKCNMVYDLKNIHLMKGDYSAIVTPNFTKFKNNAIDLFYIIGAEPNYSTFEK